MMLKAKWKDYDISSFLLIPGGTQIGGVEKVRGVDIYPDGWRYWVLAKNISCPGTFKRRKDAKRMVERKFMEELK